MSYKGNHYKEQMIAGLIIAFLAAIAFGIIKLINFIF